MKKKGLVLLLLSFLVAMIATARAEEGISVEGSVRNEMNVLIPNQYIFPHNYVSPGVYPIPQTEPYFGPREENHNVCTGLLLELLKFKSEWTPEEAKRLQRRKVKSASSGLLEIKRIIRERRKIRTKTRLTTIRRKRKEIEVPKEYMDKRIKVLTSDSQLVGVSSYSVVGPVIVYGGSKETTIDCFARSIIDTVKLGGNAILLLKSASDFRVKSSTLGIGLAYTHSYLRGNYGGTGGGGTGWARNTAEPQSKPWLHGIALRIPREEMGKIKPDMKLHPLSHPKREIPIEQKAIEEYHNNH